MLPVNDRKDLAVQALARSATISDLSARHGVSRKFVYQQTYKARVALDDAFLAAPEDDVVLKVKVSKNWLRQAIVAPALMCRGSYLGIIEFMRDLLGISISIESIRISGVSIARSSAGRLGLAGSGAVDPRDPYALLERKPVRGEKRRSLSTPAWPRLRPSESFARGIVTQPRRA
jgi:hypothetical protein